MSGDLGRRPIFLVSTASHDLQCSIYQPGRPLYARSLSSTMVPAEKVRPQFLSLQEIDPTYIAPLHCTGEPFYEAARTAMPTKLLRSYTGTRLVFEA
jgi:hypothetical protein